MQGAPLFTLGVKPYLVLNAHNILNERLFLFQLMRERARADRVGGKFLLLVLDLAERDRAGSQDLRPMLAEAAAERTRLTDLTGWMEGRVSVVLPETETRDVPKILQSIHQGFLAKLASAAPGNRSLPRLVHELYAYPGVECQPASEPERPLFAAQVPR